MYQLHGSPGLRGWFASYSCSLPHPSPAFWRPWGTKPPCQQWHLHSLTQDSPNPHIHIYSSCSQLPAWCIHVFTGIAHAQRTEALNHDLTRKDLQPGSQPGCGHLGVRTVWAANIHLTPLCGSWRSGGGRGWSQSWTFHYWCLGLFSPMITSIIITNNRFFFLFFGCPCNIWKFPGWG